MPIVKGHADLACHIAQKLILDEFDMTVVNRMDVDHGLTEDPAALSRKQHLEYVREAGSEGIELVMWLAMRGALNDSVREVYRFYHVPCSNTALGHIILENA